MRHVLSTHLFVNQRLTTAMLNRIAQAGIPAVEIFCARQHLDYRNKAQVAEIGHFLRDSDLTVHSLHAPMYDDEIWGRSGPQSVITITERDKRNRIRMTDEIKRALEVSEAVPFRYLVQHLGVSDEDFSEYKWEAAFTALEELILFARQRGVEILLENIPNALSTSERLLRFLEFTHLDLGFCFDVGHAHIMEGVRGAYGNMKQRIRSTHIHDNNGKEDQHLMPYLAEGGTVDWRETAELLASAGDQYPLCLELREAPGRPHPLDDVRAIFDRLEER